MRLGMGPETYTVDDPLPGGIDVEAVARQMPRSFLAKGMFFARIAAQLKEEFAALEPGLDAAPRLGRYLPFSDYPLSDYVRVSAAAAQKTYPKLPLREALRRLGRDDFGVFAGSTFGKVLLAAVGDARSVLLRTPIIYEKMAPGDWKVVAEELDADTVRLTFGPMYGGWEYQLGQLEGVVLSYGGSPRTTVTERPGRTVLFDIRHG
jgi:uncharacterized protein (TIGR02265 family)